MNKDMKRLLNYLLFMWLMPAVIQAQDRAIVDDYYDNSYFTPSTSVAANSLKDAWEGTAWTLNYYASFDYADKGGIGGGFDGFMISGSPIGMSFGYQGVYNLAVEKWATDGTGIYLGPNVAFPLSKELLLYAPICATGTVYTNLDGKSKVAWGASLSPSIGVKLGSLFLSAGWYLSYDFKSSKSNTNCFLVNIGMFIKD